MATRIPPLGPAVTNPVRGLNTRKATIVVNKKRGRKVKDVNANRWDCVQLLSAVVRVAEMVLELWRDHFI